jgi:hypothetical protein
LGIERAARRNFEGFSNPFNDPQRRRPKLAQDR